MCTVICVKFHSPYIFFGSFGGHHIAISCGGLRLGEATPIVGYEDQQLAKEEGSAHATAALLEAQRNLATGNQRAHGGAF